MIFTYNLIVSMSSFICLSPFHSLYQSPQRQRL
nr:MAG TPA: hypothetical protein [Bacteriophage sp.]